MRGNSFRSLFMVASCAAAALGCYLVSLRVASERAALEQVETEIVLAERDIRLLQTEIGTRGRLAQLERWNVKVLALSAPSADQFVGTSFELARMVAPKRKVDLEAPVVLAAAPADVAVPQARRSPQPDEESGAAPDQLLHTASLSRAVPAAGSGSPRAAATPAGPPRPEGSQHAALAVKAATKKVVDKPASGAPKPVTRQPKIAKSDPLAPLSDSRSSNKPKDSRTTP